MANSTIYDIALRYSVKDKGVKQGLSKIVTATSQAEKSTSSLASGFAKLSVAAGAFFGLSAAKSAFIDFNSGVEQTKIQMAGMLKLNVGGPFSDNLQRADDLFANLQVRAKASVGTTRDMAEMAAMTIRPLSQAGASMKDIEEFAVGATVASRAFGIEGGVAARDIESALMGNLRSVDRFSRALIEPMGLTIQEFNKLDAKDRFEMFKGALTQPAITEMAAAQEKSFSGVWSTLQDNMEITLGKVGLPLFQALTEEIKSWNVWIDKNGDKIEAMGKVLGDSLVSAFSILKEVGSFFVNHADTLMTLAKVWAGVKVAQFGGGLVQAGMHAAGGGLLGAGRGILGASEHFTGLGLTAAKTGSKLMTMASGITAFLGPLGLATAALIAFHQWVTEEDPRVKQLREETTDISAKFLEARKFAIDRNDISPGQREVAMERLNETAIELSKFAKAQGILTEENALAGDQAAVRTLIEKAVFDATGARVGSGDMAATTMANALLKLTGDIRNGMVDAATLINGGPAAPEMPDKVAAKTKLDVKINKIEVQSDDPDRFVFVMVSAFEDAAKNGSFSSDTISEG